MPERFFGRVILNRPTLIVFMLLAGILFLGYNAKNFRLDASAETLVLENDQDLQYSRVIDDRYGLQDYLLMTYTPKGDVFAEKTLANLRRLKDELEQLERVSSVVSILDVPLLQSPPVPIKELAGNIQTLELPTVDKSLARREFKESPLYQNLLISPDLKTTALQIIFPKDTLYENLLNRRNYFRRKQAGSRLTEEEKTEFESVSEQFQKHRDKMKSYRHQDIVAIREIMDKHRQEAELFLGGVSMIADDLISFIKKDLKVFGFGVLFFLIVTLGIIFRSIRWIFLPMLCCAFSVIAMMGLLGVFDWEVTVISSNFISLQLIITMAISIHLIVRYRELHFQHPESDQRKLVLDTACLMLTPCLYAALTTIVGFGSLVTSDILPVKTFGWMMSAGIAVSFLFTFMFFPAVLVLLGKGHQPERLKPPVSLTAFLARFTEAHGRLILAMSFIAVVLSGVGISRLVVENSFIDYFKHSTEIYQGMKVIDRRLGGTTPLDIIVQFDKTETATDTSTPSIGKDSAGVFDEFDEFDKAESEDKYWFTKEKMARIEEIHDYLDRLPETGKVLSLGTMNKIAKKLNDNKPLNNFELAILYGETPEKFKEMVLDPYVNLAHNEVRFSVRVRDSEKTLKRDLLLKKIRRELVSEIGVKKEHVHLTGMLVLYNNMLQSLFSSQILTLGIVVLALMCMFMILFRSLKIAAIAIFPNLLSIGAVLGVMGWANIPLDMMTITIAAISVGIAVDDTIHYIHRFRSEFEVDGSYVQTLHRCHESIGHAMYYTSVTIIIGFSILVLSNFIPSIYFGLLTGLAMLIALIASLTLLPQLLVVFKPFGPETNKQQKIASS